MQSIGFTKGMDWIIVEFQEQLEQLGQLARIHFLMERPISRSQ